MSNQAPPPDTQSAIVTWDDASGSVPVIVLAGYPGAGKTSVLNHLLRHPEARVGVIDVIDAVEQSSTIDQGEHPPVRYAVAMVVLISELDLVPAGNREERYDRIHTRNPRTLAVSTILGRIDPHLLFDGLAAPAQSSSHSAWPQGELPLHELFMKEYELRDEELLARLDIADHDHVHARSVTVEVPGPVSANAMLDLLESLPPGAYRAKGVITVPTGRGTGSFVVQAVGPKVFAAPAPSAQDASALVLIGADLPEDACREAARQALQPLPSSGPPSPVSTDSATSFD